VIPIIKLAFLKADGAHDVHKQLDLSGKPLVSKLEKPFQLREPMDLLKHQDLTLEGRGYCEAYSDYWNATANDEDGGYMIISINLQPSFYYSV
jgi:amidase